MQPRRLSLGADNRYIIQTIAYSSQYSCPIPSWATESAPAELSEIEKLRQFCEYNYGYRYHPNQPDRSLARRTTFTQVLFLSGLAIFLVLYASTSYSQAGLDRALNAVSLKPATPAPSAAANASIDETLAARRSQLEGTGSPTATAKPYQLLQTASKPLAEPQEVTVSQPKSSTATSSATAPNTPASKLSRLAEIEQSTHQFSLPVTGFAVTGFFGNRIHPIFGHRRFHKGIDLGTPTGTPVRAASRGRVISAGWGKGYGNRIMIDHGNGYETLYAHLDHLLVKVGDRVTNKAVIGLSGSTGYVTGPHLHFEIRFNQVAHNPLDYFEGYLKQ